MPVLVQLQSWTPKNRLHAGFAILLLFMKTTTDQSYGIIPIRKSATGWEALLIHQYSRIGDNTYWVFPKGHPESNETPIETAARELKEETGLVADRILAEPTFELSYQFRFKEVKIFKTVQFFIGLVTQDELKLNKDEVKEAHWYSVEEIENYIDYQATKTMFKSVKAYLKKNQLE